LAEGLDLSNQTLLKQLDVMGHKVRETFFLRNETAKAVIRFYLDTKEGKIARRIERAARRATMTGVRNQQKVKSPKNDKIEATEFIVKHTQPQKPQELWPAMHETVPPISTIGAEALLIPPQEAVTNIERDKTYMTSRDRNAATQKVAASDQDLSENELLDLPSSVLRRRALRPKKRTHRESLTLDIVRDPYVVAYAKRRAKGMCQLCGNPAPFNDPDGQPFLECHHVQPLAEGGEDSIFNAVALCPNCHTKMHILDLPEDREKLIAVAVQG
jgi:hypothetical protein